MCAKYGDVMSTGSERAAAEPRLERREPRHLLDQRRQILGARFGDLVAQRQQIFVEVATRRPAGPRLPRPCATRAWTWPYRRSSSAMMLRAGTAFLGTSLAMVGNGESIRILSAASGIATGNRTPPLPT